MARSGEGGPRIGWAPGLAVVKAAVLVLALAASATGARAQDIEPRAYSNTPIGVNFLIASYVYSEGGVATDRALPLRNANLQTQATVFAYARSLEVRDQSGKFDVILPCAWLSGTAEFAGQPLDQALRQHRRIHPVRQRFRHRRTRLAVPLR
jgi:hypothetical protein